jgi:DNA-binding transcriptional MocR family regulator
VIDRSGALPVDDTTLADLCLEGQLPKPIGVFARRNAVLTMGSLSKLFWGGLGRMIHGPESLIERLAEAKVVSDLGGSVLSQAVAARILGRAGSW